jgi:hypothetical protein
MVTLKAFATSALVLVLAAADALAQPSTQPGVGRFPHVTVDVRNKRILVECEALHCEAPLEFFCVVAGGSEHESVIRTRAKPSDIHTGLLMLGLTPGEPMKYSEATKKWFPPHGPPVNITMEYDKDGKHYSLPAYKLMRDLKTRQSMPPQTWIFAGSRLLEDGTYGANPTGYVVSIVNFELTLLDVPRLASSANETLEWETALDLMPPLGSPMTMIIEPLDKGALPAAPATTQSSDASAPLSDVKIDQEKVDRLRQRWEQDVKPHAAALREAAQAQYEVIASLRREQQRLIDEADRIQRLIDQMERDYQQMTTPRPE